ncbi:MULTISPECIES: ABC transporter ATP-binding protein [Bradyrhizobium]|uniref:ABC transporter ATP-binding protein n=1 Tax=Bradyrhizobium TaxID=374 RepID=UPI000571750B|nr:ABC transporter ATP-binding protein [Bradyrhizobium elkanii]MCS3524551.1 lipopolysaccharide transport system ATP-binding protein [Bradyrhizobium elkanii]MCS4072206.1 lipopolysaccharide transport system ATP-binding protein [Bradyrhizobium elkanii]MCS4078840.1 lipopolysaccharide transport system ATP-binding protein [Bradyrhizobium elkanii]MCW2122562.1 lipopolysaccharide transport system ATP-binding protein [Bradyrhizobium elkanii]MCW2169309.1 lipopolysaccharide transport system ATP-binding pr
MSSETVIEARDLGKAYLIYSKPQDRLKQMILRWRKYYREYWAVQNINLSIQRGETVGVIGRNGSGKSTLLQMIAGTLQPNVGKLAVEGRVAPLLELGAGFNPEFTGHENVRLAATILGLRPEQVEERYEAILDFAGIGDFIDQPVKTYSSGMYARLAFAVAAHVDADILIVDEILAVGDAAFTQKCMRFIRKFKEKGTLLFVSHDTATVNSLCDRAIWLDRGQLRAEGPAQEISFCYQASLQGGSEEDNFSISGRRRNIPDQKRDFRHGLIRNSDKRNLIEVFEFDPNAPSFGQRGGLITNVRIVGANGEELRVLEGGEEVTIEVTCRSHSPISSPIVGFLLRDRLGQNLFGDNTYLTYANRSIGVLENQVFRALFTFQMPYLPTGNYSISTALAEGTQADHAQHHWLDEALIFRCEGSHVTHGLIGIPMQDIRINFEPEETVSSSSADRV